MIGGLKQIAVTVKDLAASKRFYGELLGLKLLFEAPPALAFYDLGGVWLMLSGENEKERAQPGSVLYLASTDIQADYATLGQRGVGFVDQPHKVADMGNHALWMTFCRDPDGTLIALRAEVAKSATSSST